MSCDADEKLDFIEAIPPHSICMDSGVYLLGNMEPVVQQLPALGYKSRYDDVGCSFDELGFGLYATVQTVEAVTVLRRRYYDQ